MTSIASGPPGLEVPHTWEGADGNFSLNDLSSAAAQIKLTKITGLFSLPELQDQRGNRAGRRGEVVFPSFGRGKTVVYEGVVRSKSLDGMRVLAQQLRTAFHLRNSEYLMTLEGSIEWVYYARVLQLDMDEEQITGPDAVWRFQRPFTLGLRMSDPRIYVATPVDNSLAGWASASTHTVTNLGGTDSDPIFRVTVPGGTPDIELRKVVDGGAGDRRLTFSDVPAGTMVVDFNMRTASVDGADITGKLDPSLSNWWNQGVVGLYVGDNDLKVTGGAWGVAFLHPVE